MAKKKELLHEFTEEELRQRRGETYPVIRAANIQLENSTDVGRAWWGKEIANTLREYADMIDSCTAGWEHAETFTSKGGTRAFIIVANWNGEELPRKRSDRPF